MMLAQQAMNVFSCIEENVDTVHGLIRSILDEPPPMHWTTTAAQGGTLVTTLDEINQRKHQTDRFVLWEPICKKGTTVFLSNFRDGWFTLMNILANRHKREVYGFYVDDVKNKTRIGFHYSYNYTERMVRILYDDKWEFFQIGNPMPFEEVERYTSRLKTDRMNKELVKSYLVKLGWDIDHPDFYRSEQNIILGKGLNRHQ